MLVLSSSGYYSIINFPAWLQVHCPNIGNNDLDSEKCLIKS